MNSIFITGDFSDGYEARVRMAKGKRKMIQNDLQYRVTKAQVEKFEIALKDSATMEMIENVDPVLFQACKDAIKYKLNELQAQVKQYEESSKQR